jgi:hydrogenase-4 component B
VVLILLAILIAAQVVLAAVSTLVPAQVVRFGAAGITAAMALLACAALIFPDTASLLAAPLRLQLDAMGASFLLLAGVASMLRADGRQVALAGTALTLISGNALMLAVGVAAATLRPSLDWKGSLGPTLAIVCLIAAFALLGQGGDFDAIRSAEPPDAAQVTAILGLMLIAAAALLTVAPLLAFYLLVRVLFDLCGPPQSIWWTLPLLIVGAAGAIAASLRAVLAPTLHTSLAANVLHQFCLAVVALAIALLGRIVDLPALTTLALEAAWLSVTCLALCEPLLMRAADDVERAAGTRRLDRLGGLIRGMPATSACCLAGLFALSFLPAGLGFAAFWLVFQALLTATRADGIGLQVLVALCTAATASSLALATVAAVRLFGTAFLGRPRTPRAAVAEDAPRQKRLALTALAGLVLLLGFVPDLARLPALAWTGGAAVLLDLRPAYSATVIAILLALVGSGAAWLRRQGAARERRREAAWMDGFAAPPAWLPFGDPATQIGATSFIEPVRRLLPAIPSLPVEAWSVRCRTLVERVGTVLTRTPVPLTLMAIAAAIAAWLIAS